MEGNIQNHVSTRDRYGNTSFNTGLGEVPEYLQYKKKSIQNCVSAKKRVKQDIVHKQNLTSGDVFNILINSQNWIDPQSLRIGFSFNLSAAPTTYGKFNDDCGINGMIKSVKVNGSGKNIEYIYNYNLLQKIQYSCSVSNDWKQAQGGMLEGFGSYLTSTTAGLQSSSSNIKNGPSLMTAVDLASSNAYSIALWTGMLGQCGRLLPNMLLKLGFDIELAPFLDFICVDNAVALTYQVNNVYIVYDEYIVSDLYRQVFEEAVRTRGVSFDYNTVTNNQIISPALTTSISANINDSAKQLLSVYATIRPSDIATATSTQVAAAGAAAAGAVTTGVTVATGTGLCTNLETIDGSKVTSCQLRLGTTNFPEFPITKLTDMYQMSLQAMNRANSLQLDMPLSYAKYMGASRCWWFGVDFENSKSSDNSQYSGINTSGHAIQFNVSLKDNTASLVDAGCLYQPINTGTAPAAGFPALTRSNTAGSNGGNANTSFLVDFFLLHSRILSISPTGGIVVDY
jgi:hypothetical protein